MPAKRQQHATKCQQNAGKIPTTMPMHTKC